MCQQLSLFEPSFLPTWLPDEILFSFASRYHRLSGNALARTTARQLFHSATSGTLHDFPAGIDHLVGVSQGLLGTAEEILRQHTILPFYLPFQDGATRLAAVSALRGPHIGSLKFRLGLLTSRFRAHHPLKACRACMAADRDRYGMAYWHRTHQLPGVWVCPEHQEFLQTANVKTNGVGRFLWFLPEESQLSDSPLLECPAAEAVTVRELLLEHASLAMAVVQLPPDQEFTRETLARTYRDALNARGGLTAAGSLRLTKFEEDFAARYLSLRVIPEIAALPGSPEEAHQQLGRLLRKPRTGTHPLRHLFLIHFLFDDGASFLRSYQIASKENTGPPHADPSRTQPPRHSTDPRETQLVALLVDQQYSMRRAARVVGIDIGTAMHWAAQRGIATKRRPKTLHPEMRQSIIAALRSGLDPSAVADACATTRQVVSRVLRTEPDLYPTWKEASFLRLRSAHRQELSDLIKSHPTLGRKQLRTIFGAGYAWLYRHDRDWLFQHLPPASPTLNTNYGGADWAARDQAFVEQIQSVAQHLTAQRAGRKIPLWRLLSQLPELRAKFGKLDRLPLTRRLIRQITGRALPKAASDRQGDLFPQDTDEN